MAWMDYRIANTGSQLRDVKVTVGCLAVQIPAPQQENPQCGLSGAHWDANIMPAFNAYSKPTAISGWANAARLYCQHTGCSENREKNEKLFPQASFTGHPMRRFVKPCEI